MTNIVCISSVSPSPSSQRVHLAGRLEDVRPLAGDPGVLQVAPAALQDIPVNGRGVAVAAERAAPPDAEHLAVRARVHVEEERPEPDVRLDLDPYALVVGLAHDQF